jgi:hypothetical protein
MLVTARICQAGTNLSRSLQACSLPTDLSRPTPYLFCCRYGPAATEVARSALGGQPQSSVGIRGIADVGQHAQEGVDIYVSLKRQVKGSVSPHAVDVTSPLPIAIDVPGLGQVRDDALCSPLGDVKERGDISDTDLGIPRDQKQRVAVVRKKPKVRDCPRYDCHWFVCHTSPYQWHPPNSSLTRTVQLYLFSNTCHNTTLIIWQVDWIQLGFEAAQATQ